MKSFQEYPFLGTVIVGMIMAVIVNFLVGYGISMMAARYFSPEGYVEFYRTSFIPSLVHIILQLVALGIGAMYAHLRWQADDSPGSYVSSGYTAALALFLAKLFSTVMTALYLGMFYTIHSDLGIEPLLLMIPRWIVSGLGSTMVTGLVAFPVGMLGGWLYRHHRGDTAGDALSLHIR